jgi:SSS family transporter
MRLPTEHLALGDWLVIVAYLAGILAFGLWSGRGQKNTRDYFLGSKNMPWWGVGFSIVATETSALTFIGVPAMAYGPDHLTFIQIILGYVIARIILALVLVPHYFKGEIYSPYQLFAQAFGPAARRTAGGLFLLAGMLAAGVRVYVTCIPLQLMLGLSEGQIFGVILVFVVLALTYTFFGGVKSAVWVEAVQFLIFLTGGLFALFYIPTLVEGGLAGAFSRAADGGKLEWLNAAFSLGRPFNLWMGLIGATFLVLSSHGADQLIVQRVLTCKSVSEGRRALVLSAVLIFPLFLIFLLTGVMLWVYYQQFPNLPIALPEARPGVNKNDYIFPIFILTMVPPGLRGCLLVAILAAAMSSVSAALSALASVFTMDFYKGLVRAVHDEAHYLRFSKGATLGWAVLIVSVAVLTSQVESVLNAAFALNGLTSGAMLGGLILTLVWRQGRAAPVITGMLTALVVMAALHSLPRLAWSQAWWERTVGVVVFWPWYTLIGTTITLAVAALTRGLLVPREARREAQARN